MWLSPNDLITAPSSGERPIWLPVTSLSPSRNTAWLPLDSTPVFVASLIELWNALITDFTLNPEPGGAEPHFVFASGVLPFGPNDVATASPVLSTIALSRSVTNDEVTVPLAGPLSTPTPLLWMWLFHTNTFVVGAVDWTEMPALNW